MRSLKQIILLGICLAFCNAMMAMEIETMDHNNQYEQNAPQTEPSHAIEVFAKGNAIKAVDNEMKDLDAGLLLVPPNTPVLCRKHGALPDDKREEDKSEEVESEFWENIYSGLAQLIRI